MSFAELARHEIASGELAHNGAVSSVIDVAAAVAVDAAQTVAHGIGLAGVASVPVTAEMSLDYTTVDIDIDVAATIPVIAAADAVHGVATNGVAAVSVTAEMLAAHGVAISASAVIGVVALQNVVHGVAMDGTASIPVSAAVAVLVERYELRGQVRLGGVLVNRRVRAYLRSSGALLGEADTSVGRFRVPTGFAAAECYVTPIDLADGATDWLPPTSNRITSVLALDTA